MKGKQERRSNMSSEMKLSNPLCFLLSIIFLYLLVTPAFAVQKTYIVYLKSSSRKGRNLAADPHVRMRTPQEIISYYLKREAQDDDNVLYKYKKVMNGFAAVLHEEEAQEMAKHPRVLSIFESKHRKFQTTRSWRFLGLEHDDGIVPHDLIWEKANYGEDIIIANVDSGVWPESESFNDKGYGDIPKKWKGACENENDPTFHCNRKLIGARYFYKDYASSLKQRNLTFHLPKTPRDPAGHGTHTLSTAGGNFVPHVNYHGYFNGTAKGGAPRARLAAYKACWINPEDPEKGESCPDADVLAAIEAAIDDDVDVLSLSIGFASFSYFADPLAVGSFHAVKNGISVVAATGNEGPGPLTASNLAPWLLTVGASSIDRELVNYLTLGNKMIIKGSSLTNKALPTKKLYPLAFGVDVAANNDTKSAMFCVPGSLDPAKMKGKILVCIRGQAYLRDFEAHASDGGAVGLILVNNKDTGEDVMPVEFSLPFTLLPFSKGEALFSYINSTRSPVAYLTRGMDMVGRTPAPVIAMFSSRGPNIVTPEILKPDITAPGIDILAATSQATKGPYETMQGTSMACPHVAGVAALLKKIHPHWSPSAIKSTIMTTASTLDSRNKPMLDYTLEKATPFDYGSGHMMPNLAMDPGLVYDMDHHDYLKFLCAIGYEKDMIKAFSKFSYYCPESVSLADFNYPSITVHKLSGNATVTRRLKNVGTPGIYVALVNAPAGVTVTVEPSKLTFEKKGQELKFSVIFTVDGGHRQLPRGFLFGDLVWSDGKHNVRSPLVMSLKINHDY